MTKNNGLGPAPWILVVDDNPGVRGPVSDFLSIRGGYQVDTAETLAQARARLTSGRLYAGVVLDTDLPDGQGYDLVKATDEGIHLEGYLSAVRPVLIAVSEFKDNQRLWRGAPFLQKGEGLGARVVQTMDDLLGRK
ncbi:MAG: response regulator [Candidatus Woesearchaeota archaeon]